MLKLSISPYLIFFLSVLLFLFPSTLSATKLRDCPPAFGYATPNATKCTRCPRGTYSTIPYNRPVNARRRTCLPCGAGTFTPSWSGVAEQHLCRECPPDSTSAPGSWKCRPCLDAKSLRLPSGRCAYCPPGTERVWRACWPCDYDRIQPLPNQNFCIDCPFGTMANKQQTKCEKVKTCPDGTIYKPLDESCVLCDGNLSHDEGHKKPVCNHCPRRTLTVAGKNGAKRKCRRCPPGFFMARKFDRYYRFGVRFYCKPCLAGTYTNGYSKPTCRRRSDGTCPKNTFIDSQGDCNDCDEGFRLAPALKRCVKCPKHSTSTGGLVKKCTKCAADEMIFRGKCRCKVGTIRSKKTRKCVPCPRGTQYWNTDSAYPDQFRPACLPCSADYFNDRAGTGQCTRCPWGSSSWPSNGKKCVKYACSGGLVPAHLKSNVWAMVHKCVSPVTGCPPGLRAKYNSKGRVVCTDAKGKLVCPKGIAPDKISCLSFPSRH